MLFQVQGRAPTTIKALAALELSPLASDNSLDIIGQPKRMDELFVDHLGVVSGDCAHCQFRLEGNTELANHDYVQWGMKSASDLGRNRNPTAREP